MDLDIEPKLTCTLILFICKHNLAILKTTEIFRLRIMILGLQIHSIFLNFSLTSCYIGPAYFYFFGIAYEYNYRELPEASLQLDRLVFGTIRICHILIADNARI